MKVRFDYLEFCIVLEALVDNEPDTESSTVISTLYHRINEAWKNLPSQTNEGSISLTRIEIELILGSIHRKTKGFTVSVNDQTVNLYDRLRGYLEVPEQLTDAQINCFGELADDPASTLDHARRCIEQASVEEVIDWCNDPTVYDAETVKEFRESVDVLIEHLGPAVPLQCMARFIDVEYLRTIHNESKLHQEFQRRAVLANESWLAAGFPALTSDQIEGLAIAIGCFLTREWDS